LTKALLLYSLDSLPTTITALGAGEIAKDLASLGVDIVQLDIWECVNPAFQLQNWINKPDLIIYLGHGDDDRLYGQLPIGLIVPLVQVLTNYLLSGTITIAYACDSGRVLGPSAPSRAYIGATDPYNVALTYPEHDYMSDFFETWKVIPEALVQGKSVGDALSLYQAKCTEYITLYGQHLSDWSAAAEFQQFLTQNRDSFKVFGDATAKL
jgi:hypothetical protein